MNTAPPPAPALPDAIAIEALLQAIARRLLARGQRVATAESCTGGLIARLMTDLPGSSRWFERGVVTYSNQAKQDLLGVPAEVLDEHGAVSAPVVLAMAEGLLARAPVDFTLAVSGIAGPDGGTPDKPVGTVWLAWAGKGIASSASRLYFPGGREAVRLQAAVQACTGLRGILEAPASVQ